MSQESVETKTIEGIEYTVRMLPPMESNDLLMDVAQMIGPSIGPILDKFFGKASLEDALDQQVTPEFFAKAATALFGGLSKQTVRAVIEAMKKISLADNKPLAPVFDVHFMGKLDQMYAWLAFAMRVQWGKCFSALVQTMAVQGAAALQKTGSQ
ncbi:MAG: hypothetical protein GY847_31840 [Proteobacteria bacterium]|nr:hypothetical protein [Pseudomonadota bacterium]